MFPNAASYYDMFENNNNLNQNSTLDADSSRIAKLEHNFDELLGRFDALSINLRKLVQLEQDKTMNEAKSSSAKLQERQQAVYLFLEAVDRIPQRQPLAHPHGGAGASVLARELQESPSVGRRQHHHSCDQR